MFFVFFGVVRFRLKEKLLGKSDSKGWCPKVSLIQRDRLKDYGGKATLICCNRSDICA